MIEQLFGSKTRVKLLRLFLANPRQFLYIREMTRKISSQINAVRREHQNLEDFGIIKAYVVDEETGEYIELKNSGKMPVKKKNKKYYQLNTSFILYPEIRTLFFKSELFIEKDLVQKIRKIGNIKYLVLTGVFVGIKDSPIDLLVVGMVDKAKMVKLIDRIQKMISGEINYTVMTEKEFKYRKDILDGFLYKILNNRKIVFTEGKPDADLEEFGFNFQA